MRAPQQRSLALLPRHSHVEDAEEGLPGANPEERVWLGLRFIFVFTPPTKSGSVLNRMKFMNSELNSEVWKLFRLE